MFQEGNNCQIGNYYLLGLFKLLIYTGFRIFFNNLNQFTMSRSNVSFPKLTLSPPSRKLKVYYAYYGNGFKNSYPVIRIAGKYLRSFGFEIGTEFQIDLEADKITVTRIVTS